MADVWPNSRACHLRATCHIAGCKNSIRHIENRYSPYFFLFAICNFGLWRAAAYISSSTHLFNLIICRFKVLFYSAKYGLIKVTRSSYKPILSSGWLFVNWLVGEIRLKSVYLLAGQRIPSFLTKIFVIMLIYVFVYWSSDFTVCQQIFFYASRQSQLKFLIINVSSDNIVWQGSATRTACSVSCRRLLAQKLLTMTEIRAVRLLSTVYRPDSSRRRRSRRTRSVLSGTKNSACKLLGAVIAASVNPVECRGNHSATSNNMKSVHWPLTGGLLHLVQLGGDWARLGPSSLYQM